MAGPCLHSRLAVSRARQIGTQAIGGERLLGTTGLDSSGTHAEAAKSQILASACQLFGVLLVNTCLVLGLIPGQHRGPGGQGQ